MGYAERTAKANIESYKRSRMYDIGDAYGRYSSAKAHAWEYCVSRCETLNGDCLKVISKNTFVFTAGFTFMEDGKRKFYYITPNYDAVVDFYEEG